MSNTEFSEENPKWTLEGEDNRPEVQLLFNNLKKEITNLTELLVKYSDHWNYEDSIYRFYHQSMKVYRIQDQTVEIVEKLKSLLPGYKLNEWFLLIVDQGTGKEFKQEDNENWLEMTRPMVEAFFHARYFLKMAVKYGNELEYPPNLLPSGWASLLYLYNLR